MLFDRDIKQDLGRIETRGLPEQSLVGLLQANPLSQHFIAPGGTEPKDIVTYLIARQKSRYGETILDQIDHRTLLRHVNMLLSEFDAELIKRTVAYCAWASDYPFSFKFVRECIDEVKDLCPFLT